MVDPLVALLGMGIAIAGFDLATEAASRLGVSVLPDDGTGTLSSDLGKWIVAGVVVGYVLLVEGRSLASIGVEAMAPLPFVAWVVAGVVLTVVLTGSAYVLYDRLGWTTPEGFVADQLERSVPARTFTVVTAGVTESILFQGYPIERIDTLIGASWLPFEGLALAGALSFLAFTLVHYVGDTFSLVETVYIGVPALCVTVLYVLTGNLFVVITVHALVDGISLLGPELAGDHGREGPAETPG